MADAYPRARLAMPGHRAPSTGSLRSGPMRARVGWDGSDTPPALLGLGTIALVTVLVGRRRRRPRRRRGAAGRQDRRARADSRRFAFLMASTSSPLSIV